MKSGASGSVLSYAAGPEFDARLRHVSPVHDAARQSRSALHLLPRFCESYGRDMLVPFSVETTYESYEPWRRACTFVSFLSSYWFPSASQKQATKDLAARISPVTTQPECKNTCSELSSLVKKYNMATRQSICYVDR
jgi:hypothetical protein